jgi:DNA-binding transcriptional ArsR family regulator
MVSRHDPPGPARTTHCPPVPEAGQWLITTGSRLAGDGYSWLQAVYWVAETGCYQPARGHGPRFGATSVRVARVLAGLSPCRPGVGYLVRELRLSERTVKYHLAMLREAGLLAYVVRGSRAPGGVMLASEFALVIPPQFDAALGVRTAGEGARRRPVGIAEDGRHRITALGLLAAADSRRSRPGSRRSGGIRRRPKTPSNSADQKGRCTPMESGSGSLSPTATPCLPPDGCRTAQQARAVRTTRSVVAGESTELASSRPHPLTRRFRLAGELIEQVPWLGRAALPRVAWVAREVADAGWHVAEVVAWLSLSAPPARVRRPSAFLAHRLKGAHLIATTAAQRAELVEDWRDRRAACSQGQQEWEGRWQPPSDPAVRAAVCRAMAAPAPRSGTDDVQPHGANEYASPTREELAHLRAASLRDPSLVRAALDTCGEEFAARLYTPRLVEVVRAFQRRAAGATRLRLHGVDDGIGRP